MSSAGSGAPRGGGLEMSQFFQVFFDEAAERLAEMETLLVQLDPAHATQDQLNAIFRAAHSIKGGSGTFGFADMTEVTHELESLLDRARNQELALTPEMIDALLAAGDVLKGQLARHQGKAAEAPPAREACERIRRFAAPAALERDVEIAFPRPAAGAEAALEPVYAELATLGRFEKLADKDGALRVRLATRAADDELRVLFAFAVDPDSVAIRPAGDAGYGFFEPPPEAPEACAQRAQPKAAPPAQAESASIRVSVEKVDQLVNQVGELVITQAMLSQNVARLDPTRHQALANAMAALERNTRDLQEAVMSIRMLPIAFLFNRYPRLVRELAGKLGKRIELATAGEATELDKSLIETIADPLTHLVRNAIDHGIETPQARLAAGKPQHGSVTLSASHRGGSIVIEVADDGAGLDRARILAKARERGMEISDDVCDRDLWQVIFEPGFSTAAAVTDVSGRGVGMDVVRRNIEALGGSVEIDSRAGEGTRIAVRVPLTLAITDGMLVGAGGETYIVPLAAVVESLQANDEQVRPVSGAGRVVRVRAEYLPVVSLRQQFGLPAREDCAALMVIVEAEGGKTALLVDELLGQQQVVVKNLETNFRKVPGASGATILGDGRVALILDVPTLVRRARH